MKKFDKTLTKFDRTLTKEEREALTFLEWSDETLARGVREMARELHDGVGFGGISGQAAAITLEKIIRDAGMTEMHITIGKTKITVRIG